MTKVGNILRKATPFIGKFLKGGLQGTPGIGFAIRGIEAVTKKDIVTGTPKTHDRLVLIAEGIGLICVISFLVYKGIIPQDVLLKVIDALISAF